jgi:hypothetical protein
MLLKQLDKSGSLRPPCAWAISVDPLDFTPVMLDVNSRYHVLALPKDRLPPMVRQPQTFRIRSYFQQVRRGIGPTGDWTPPSRTCVSRL